MPHWVLPLLVASCVGHNLQAQVFSQAFHLPTANRTLFDAGREADFFVGTVGRPWISGTFGCVRTEGWQMHEGLDVRSIERGRNGEPRDPVRATADGVAVYLNAKAGLSSYGIYAVLAHPVEGIQVFSLYAHLSQIREGLRAGMEVRAGEIIGTMGRTANTQQRISKERAHLHFELGLLANPQFEAWRQQKFKGQRNYHGIWNGRNFLGMDARLLFLSQQRFPANFSLVRFVEQQPELLRVRVHATGFPWLERYAPLTENPQELTPEEIAGYEMHLDYTGIPIRSIACDAGAFPGKRPERFELLAVNEAEYQRNPCRRLVVRQGRTWQLGRAGRELLELITYRQP